MVEVASKIQTSSNTIAVTATRPDVSDTRAQALRGAICIVNSLLLATLTIMGVEWLARGSLDGVAEFMTSLSRPGLTAIGLLFLMMLALDALLGRAYQSALIVAPIALLPAFVSGQKQLFLSDPLYPSDFLFGRQIAELLPVMVAARPLAAVAISLSAAAAIGLLVYFWFFAWRRFPELSARSKLARLALALPLIGLFLPLMDYARYSPLRDRLNIIPMMWDQTENYRHNGFLLAFTFNLPMAKITAPVGYSPDAIDAISPGPTIVQFGPRREPDVIMIMSESFWDPTRLTNVGLSPDPMPTVRENQSGHVFSPEFGGMTANVEFEALTGFSNAYLPYGSIPYQQYVRHPLPSLATFFRSKGYTAKSFHPFQSWFWNRSDVYSAFGFESFESEESMPPMEKRGIFASDEALTREIIRQADNAEDPFFYFAVSLQGHGPYEANRYAHNTISVSAPGLSAHSRDSVATYAQGIREADQSLKTLMDWAKGRDRETIIVLFGDHLPPLGSVYPESGFMRDEVATRKASPLVMKRQHETPLVIWSSKKGLQKDIGTISPSLLPYHIVKLAGFRHPYYTGLLGRVQRQYGIVDRYQLIGRDGLAQPDWSLSGGRIDRAIRDQQLLQHDMMFGDRHGAQRFFPEDADRRDPSS